MAVTRRSGATRRRASTPAPPSAARTAAPSATRLDQRRALAGPRRRAAAWRVARAACAIAWLAARPAHASPASTVAAHAWCGVDSPHLAVLTDGMRSVGTRVALRLEPLRQALAVLVPPLVQDADPVQVIVFRDATLAAAYAPTWRGMRD